MESPRRYPRTLQEAFGPHTSRDLHTKPPRASLRAWAMYLAVLAIALACAALTGCGNAQADGLINYKSAPDEYGVVCYRIVDTSINARGVSCVKVK